MKTKRKVVAIGIFILISGCTTTKNINTEKKDHTKYIYNTVCIDQESNERHHFKTNSYIQLNDYQISLKVYHEGIKNSLNMNNMNCSQNSYL